MQTLDMAQVDLRTVNATLQDQAEATNQSAWEVLNPRGSHAVAVL